MLLYLAIETWNFSLASWSSFQSKFNILVNFFVCKLYYNYYLVSDFLRSCLSSICLLSLYFFVRPAVTSCFTLLPSRLLCWQWRRTGWGGRQPTVIPGDHPSHFRACQCPTAEWAWRQPRRGLLETSDGTFWIAWAFPRKTAAGGSGVVGWQQRTRHCLWKGVPEKWQILGQ